MTRRAVGFSILRIILQGEVADSANTPPGCHFHPWCNYAQAICREKSQVQDEIAPNHFVSCHRAKELSLRGVARSIAQNHAGIDLPKLAETLSTTFDNCYPCDTPAFR